MASTCPSPKVQSYRVIDPYATVEAAASNVVAAPGGALVTVKLATGAWSGVIAIPRGVLPTELIGVPATPVAVAIGVTVAPVSSVIVTVWPGSYVVLVGVRSAPKAFSVISTRTRAIR